MGSNHDGRDFIETTLATLAEAETPPYLAPMIVDRLKAGDAQRRQNRFASIASLAGLAAALAVGIVVVWVGGTRTPPPATSGSESAASVATTASAAETPSASPSSPTPLPSVSPYATPTEPGPEPTPSSDPSRPVIVGDVQFAVDGLRGPLSRRFGATGIWTGTEAIIWGGGAALTSNSAQTYSDGAGWNPESNTWRSIAESPLQSRRMHVAGWTGTEMLVWGGDDAGESLNDGAAYDPTSDSWRPIAQSPIEWRPNAAAAWWGSEWVVAATAVVGDREELQFAAYDPELDVWRELPSLDSRLETETTLVAAGPDLVVLNANTGLRRLRPGSDTWEQFPELRLSEGPVWTGTQLFAMNLEYLGITEPRYRATLAAWQADSGDWQLIPDPAGQIQDAGLFGAGAHLMLLTAGLVYDSVSDEWWSAEVPESVNRVGSVRLWLGDRLVIWGGGGGDPSKPLPGGTVLTPAW